MTNITIGERGSGKTTKLIKRSVFEGLTILVATRFRRQALIERAEEMGLRIPSPISVDEFFRTRCLDGSSIRRDGLLIDDADDVLQQIFAGIPIEEVTVTDKGNISWPKPIRYEDRDYRVKHGKWIEQYMEDGCLVSRTCSCCGHLCFIETPYCSSCGAKMDEH